MVRARVLCPIKGFQWAQASVRLNVVVLRETYADAHQEGWALLTTEDFVDPLERDAVRVVRPIPRPGSRC